jgi:magnesium chelatase family protein
VVAFVDSPEFDTPVKVSGSFARVRTFAFAGIEAVPVEVQVQISSGQMSLIVVGLPDKAVGEARERVRAVFTAMGLSLPPRRVLINLAPADLLSKTACPLDG